METNFPNDTYELIFVNDGSPDNSLQKLLDLNKKDKRVKVISFSRNFGQGAAIVAAWHYAKGDSTIYMAADLQDPPSSCIQMINEWKAGNEVVICYRETHGNSFARKITSRIGYKLLLPNGPATGFDVALLDRKALNAINQLTEKNRFLQYDILWAGFKVKYIPYDKLERPYGKSAYSFLKRMNSFYMGFLNISYLPLRLLTTIGVCVFIFSILFSIGIIKSYFEHRTPFNGWAPIMILILFMGGLIMVMLGILGEYIWRILEEVKRRPVYIIDKIVE